MGTWEVITAFCLRSCTVEISIVLVCVCVHVHMCAHVYMCVRVYTCARVHVWWVTVGKMKWESRGGVRMELLSGATGSPGVSERRKEAREQRLRDEGLTHLDT